MFYLRNLVSGEERTFESKQAVLSYWRWRIQGEHQIPSLITKFDFSELNITGKDTIYAITKKIPVWMGYSYEYEWRLKQYQVLDECRRSCDIREWTQEAKVVLAETYPSWFPRAKAPHSPRFRMDPVGFGFKRSHPNRQLPSFTKQRMEIYQNKHDLDPEYDLLGLVPMKDHSKPRKLDWTYKKHKDSDNHSWKRSTKNRSQWGRHKSRAPEGSMKRIIAQAEAEWSAFEDAFLSDIVDDLGFDPAPEDFY